MIGLVAYMVDDVLLYMDDEINVDKVVYGSTMTKINVYIELN